MSLARFFFFHIEFRTMCLSMFRDQPNYLFRNFGLSKNQCQELKSILPLQSPQNACPLCILTCYDSVLFYDCYVVPLYRIHSHCEPSGQKLVKSHRYQPTTESKQTQICTYNAQCSALHCKYSQGVTVRRSGPGLFGPVCVILLVRSGPKGTQF